MIKGKGAMPPKAGDASLTDDRDRARGRVHGEPGRRQVQGAGRARGEAGGRSAAQPSRAAADGKAVYDKVCFACHQQSVAGSPKLGDKAAWAPRIKTGTDALVQSVIKGKGAMPPKAGNPSLSDAEIRAAVEFMVSQSK